MKGAYCRHLFEIIQINIHISINLYEMYALQTV